MSIDGTPGPDNLSDTSGNDTINGGAGNDTITVTNGNDTANGGADTDTLVVDYHDDTHSVTTNGFGADSTNGGLLGQYTDGTGLRLVNFSGIEIFHITTGTGNDTIQTGDGDDVLTLGGGNDFTNVAKGVNIADGGSGTDGFSADFSGQGAGVSIDLRIAVNSGAFGSYSNFEYFGTIQGSTHDDIFIGTGAAQNEAINGGAGNDRIGVLNGSDTVNGGSGTDTLVVDYSGTTRGVTTNSFGPDSTNGGYLGQYTDGSGVRLVNFSGIDKFDVTTSIGNDNITTGDGDDIVHLGDGDDSVTIGKGFDTADGGVGNDGLSADFSDQAAGVAIDLRNTTSAGTFGAFSNFEYFGTIQGSGFDDTFIGTTAANNETINGGGGNDIIGVFNGSDTANGGAGTDTLVVDYSATIRGVTTASFGPDSTNGGYLGQYTDGSGVRLVNFSGIDKFDVTTGIGNDNITTGDGNDIVDTGDGADTVNVGKGVDTADGGAGNDGVSADFSDQAAGVAIDLRNATSSGAFGSFSNFEYFGTVTGSAHDDTLIGTTASNNETISGGAGNDVIGVLNGNDTANGGADSDTLIVDYSGTVHGVTTNAFGAEATGGGFHGQYTDGTGTRLVNYGAIETFHVTTGIGNDSIATGDGDDVVSLGDGDDLTDVGKGVNTADGGIGTDGFSADFSAQTGAVTIDLGNATSSGAFGSYSNFEYFGTITGSAHDDIFIGTDALRSDAISGGAGNDMIGVFNGNDTAHGGADSDTLVVDYSGATRGVSTNSFGTDSTNGGYLGQYTDGSGTRQVNFDGIDRFDVTTGTGNDTVQTGDGDDIVHLGDGDDSVTIGKGIDTADGGIGNDGLSADFSSQAGGVSIDLRNAANAGAFGSFSNFEHFGTVQGSAFDDSFIGTTAANNETINGGAGNDIIGVFNGSDTANGGADTDTLVVDYSGTIRGVSTASFAADSSNGGYLGQYTDGSGLRLVNFSGIDKFDVTTGIGNDNITTGDGNDIVRPGAGSDTVNTQGGNDSITIDAAGAKTVNAGSGSDTLTIDYGSATGAVTTNIGPNANGTLGGWNGQYFNTTDNSNVNYNSVEHFNITTGSGDDNIITRDGNDVVNLNGGDDFVDVGPGADTADGGTGTDGITADLTDATGAVIWNLQTNSFSGAPDSFANFEYFGTITTAGGGDVITTASGSHNETINTGEGDDTITIVDGSDTVNAGRGSDTLIVDYSNATGGVSTNIGPDPNGTIGGWDGQYVNSTDGSSANYNSIEQFDITTGSGGDQIVTENGNDTVTLNGGNDFVDIGTGTDTADGGTGTDGISADLTDAAGAVIWNLQTNSFSGGPDSFANFEYFGTIATGAGDDVITTASGGHNETIDTGGGADTITTVDGGDTVDGGTGSDTLIVDYSAATASVTTNIGPNPNGTDGGWDGQYFNATDSSNVNYTSVEQFDITSGSGDDSITTAEGADIIATGSGNDTVHAAGGNDLVDGGAGDDVLDGGTGVDTLSYANAAAGVTVNLGTTAQQDTAGAGLDTISGFENLVGSNHDDHLTGDGGDNIITGGTGNDAIDGGGGVDTANYATAASGVTVDLSVATAQSTGGAGTDTLTNIENLVGSAFADTLYGSAGDNVIDAGAGDDAIIVTGGVDTVTGGLGTDTLVIGVNSNPGGVTLNGLIGDAVNGYSGTATWGVNSVTFSGIENFVIESAGNFTDHVTTGGGNDTFYHIGINDPSYPPDTADLGAGNDKLVVDFSATHFGGASNAPSSPGTGTFLVGGFSKLAYANVEQLDFTGTDSSDVVIGFNGNDILRGGGGSDTLEGGTGDDTIDGGAGNDTVQYSSATAGVTVDLSLTTAQDTIGAGVDTITFVENITGSSFVDHLTGDGNANILNGLAGADVMTGGTGDDTYFVDDAGDQVIELAGGGTADTVETTLASYILGANLENLIGQLDTGQSLTGNGDNNAITGDDGNDVIDGGAGDDTMAGGLGDDTYFVDGAGDSVVEDSGAGTDTIETGLASYSIFSLPNVENLTGTSNDGQFLTGNSGANVITGGDGADTIDGAGGADTLQAGLGNDTYILSAIGATITDTGGTDEVLTSLHSFSLVGHDDIENLRAFASSTGYDFTGNGLDNVIKGSDGDDVIDGGAGADTMNGGAGNDTYGIDDVGDVVTGEDAASGGGGEDEIQTTLATYSIAALHDIEDLTGLLDTGQTLTGNDGDNAITGGGGADVLTGGGSTDGDVLTGNAGDDRLIVSTGLNSIVFGGADTDTLVVQAGDQTGGFTMAVPTVDSVNGGLEGSITEAADTLGVAFSGIEKFDITTGSGDDSIVTGNGDDVISTGGGNDAIDGGAGADIMTGGTGDDIYYVDDAGDQVIEDSSGGTDEVRTALASYTLSANVEKLTYTGSSDFHATGTTGGETIRAGSGNDVIDGGGGNDFFDLHDGGSDDATGGSAVDVFYYGAALDQGDSNHGGGGNDIVAIQGDYSGGVMLGANALDNVETLAILTHSDARFGGDSASPYSYDITTDDGNVAAGGRLIVNASTLQAGENFTFDGSAESDGAFFIYGGQGTDNLTGGTGVDVFFFAEDRYAITDQVHGGAGDDIMVLRGNYDLTLDGSSIQDVETVVLMSGSDTRFYPAGTDFNYSITTDDDTVASGATMTFNGGALKATETLTFDGSAETNGNFRLFGGAGDDHVTGGAGNDLIYGGLGQDVLIGGGGTDVFRYQGAGESVVGNEDQIQDFTTGDVINLSRIDAISGTSHNDAFTFVSAFSGHAGELTAAESSLGSGVWTVSGDIDGDGNADFQLMLTVADHHAIGAADFIL